MSYLNKLLVVFLFLFQVQAQGFYTVEDIVHDSFLVIKGQTYEISSSCHGKFAEIGDELLFTSISASSAHCDHVLAKNNDNGKFCQLFCL